jgi:hypothetical protein
MGTAAFGSLILAVINMARIVLTYIKKKFADPEVSVPLLTATATSSLPLTSSSQNRLHRCVLCCFHCCLTCLEECVKFINKHAYIQVSLPSLPSLLFHLFLLVCHGGNFVLPLRHESLWFDRQKYCPCCHGDRCWKCCCRYRSSFPSSRPAAPTLLSCQIGKICVMVVCAGLAYLYMTNYMKVTLTATTALLRCSRDG